MPACFTPTYAVKLPSSAFFGAGGTHYGQSVFLERSAWETSSFIWSPSCMGCKGSEDHTVYGPFVLKQWQRVLVPHLDLAAQQKSHCQHHWDESCILSSANRGYVHSVGPAFAIQLSTASTVGIFLLLLAYASTSIVSNTQNK